MVPRCGDGVQFLENNFLSNDRRYPLTQIETNSARAFELTRIWSRLDKFLFAHLQELSPVDELEFFNPLMRRIRSNSN